MSDKSKNINANNTINSAIVADSADENKSDNTVEANKTRPPAPWKSPNFYQEQSLLSSRHGETHREDSMGNHWSVPWSDLMMVMFVLFAALVTAQTMQRNTPEFIDREKINNIEIEIEKEKIIKDEILSPEPNFEPLMRINVFEKSQQAIREANIENVEIVLMEDQSVKVSVQGPLFFDLGADSLKPDVKKFLKTLSGVIRQTAYKVNVIGHTDDKPIKNTQFDSNWELSLMRATQVTKYLINEGQIDPARFTIMGRSQYDPATPNANDQFRSLNRRVEIIITRENIQSVEDRL